MHRHARLAAIGFAILASMPGASQAGSGPDDLHRAACRDQALAAGLRSEEVILDYIHECLQAGSDAEQTRAPSAGAAYSAGGTVPSLRQGSAGLH